jgi:hypothetical protein
VIPPRANSKCVGMGRPVSRETVGRMRDGRLRMEPGKDSCSTKDCGLSSGAIHGRLDYG